MATHLNPATNPTSTVTAHGPWNRLSAAFTGQVPSLADRDDLIVTCAPGAGHGAPGCFIPALATIELDGAHLGHDPGACDPSRPSDRERYPALWGVLVHEAAHAHHSTWHTTLTTAPPTAPPTGRSAGQAAGVRGAAHLEAAVLLEESRIEAAHLARRPGDHRWLRASATRLVLADFTPGSPSPPPGGAAVSAGGVRAAMTSWDAGCAAALLLARVTAGVLDTDETAPVARAVCEVIGSSRLSVLAELWCRAHRTADHDTAGMLELGRLWCDCLSIDPAQPPPPPGTGADADAASSALAAAITDAVQAITDADAPPAPAPGPDRSAERRAEKQARDQAERAASRVFGDLPKVTPHGPTKITGTRAATPVEQAAARRLARHLRSAAHRDRATTTHNSPTPPGRLRMREALAADAQRAAGAVPTAEPFTRTVHRHVPSPPLRVGIACDVSGSMRRLAHPVASAAWILGRAAGHVPDARAATVIFGATVRPVTHPGRPPSRVHEFSAADNCHAFAEAVDALDAALDLSRPGAARLLIVVSDGGFHDAERTDGQQRITRLTRSGCAVLWLALGMAIPMDGIQPVLLGDPADAATTIGQAATRALRNA